MKLKIIQLIDAMNSYNKIDKEKFSLKTTYKLLRLFQEIEREIECYEDAVRSTLIKYAKKDENNQPIIKQTEQGDSIELSPEDRTICISEINELDQNEIEIKDCYLNIEDFGNISVSMEELKGLLPFIKEE